MPPVSRSRRKCGTRHPRDSEWPALHATRALHTACPGDRRDTEELHAHPNLIAGPRDVAVRGLAPRHAGRL